MHIGSYIFIKMDSSKEPHPQFCHSMELIVWEIFGTCCRHVQRCHKASESLLKKKQSYSNLATFHCCQQGNILTLCAVFIRGHEIAYDQCQFILTSQSFFQSCSLVCFIFCPLLLTMVPPNTDERSKPLRILSRSFPIN